MAKRVIMRIELTPQAKARLNEFTEEKGMTQVAVTSRLVEWFALQPDTVQSAILGLYPADIQAQVVRLILRQLNSAKPAKPRRGR